MRAPRPSPLPLLPRFFTFFFCAATLWLLLAELLPALREHRAARAAFREQVDGYRAVVKERDEMAREQESLRLDPQERERALDAKGYPVALPPSVGER